MVDWQELLRRKSGIEAFLLFIFAEELFSERLERVSEKFIHMEHGFIFPEQVSSISKRRQCQGEAMWCLRYNVLQGVGQHV